MVLLYLFREKRDINWIIKVMKAPVIFFSNNYLCKSIPGCPGSGVFKNTSKDVRNHIINLMKESGLLISGVFMSATKNDSYAKLPPSTLRQQQQTTNFFNKCGQIFTITTYEKLFDTFGLVTMIDTTVVPITSTAINILRNNNDYINYYHCLEKEKGINNMIQERLALKEINIVYSYNNGPYRFEPNITNAVNPIVFQNNSIDDVNDESKNSSEKGFEFFSHVLSACSMFFF